MVAIFCRTNSPLFSSWSSQRCRKSWLEIKWVTQWIYFFLTFLFCMMWCAYKRKMRSHHNLVYRHIRALGDVPWTAWSRRGDVSTAAGGRTSLSSDQPDIQNKNRWKISTTSKKITIKSIHILWSYSCSWKGRWAKVLEKICSSFIQK